jgi:hypothetical protein
MLIDLPVVKAVPQHGPDRFRKISDKNLTAGSGRCRNRITMLRQLLCLSLFCWEMLNRAECKPEKKDSGHKPEKTL